MGSNQSVGSQEIDIIIDHPNFVHAKIYTHNSTSKLVASISIDQTLFKSWQQQLSSHQIRSQFALLPQSSHYSHENFCSMKGTAKIVYDNFPYLLKNEIHDRAGKNQRFTEEELWYLILAIFSVKKQFLTLKINEGNLGNVSSQNIFLSQKGQIKIGSYLSWPGNIQCLEKIFQSNGRQLIAPEDLIQLQLGKIYCRASSASQMFAIGMTVLSAVTLKESFTLYNLKTKRLNFNQALIRIQQMRDMPHYSDTLKAVVELMCAFEVNYRLQMQEIGEILFRCESSIKLKRQFVAYPFGQKIEKKLREYRSNQQVFFKAGTLSIMSSIGPNELNLQSPQNSKLAQLKRNSMDLTQVILGPQTRTNKKKSSKNTDSLMSSDQLVTFKKTQSNPKEEKEKPFQRYQEINANFGSNSLTDMDYLHLINMAKQVIIQKPVVIDTKRRSDDIIEEVTPVETPDQSHTGQENQGFERQFLVPKQYTRESIHFNFVQKNPLSKTTNVNFRPNESHHQEKFKVKSAQSQEPEAGSSNRRQDLMRTQNQSVVVYVPINDSLDQSLKYSWQSQHFSNNKPKRKILQSALPSLIQEYSREQSSQIQTSKLSQKEKQYIQSKILQKLNEINIDEKKKVKFAQVQDIIDYSHQSKILQIDDIGLDCIDNDGKNIFIEYKQPNKNEIVVQSVRISNKNNFLYINEDEN